MKSSVDGHRFPSAQFPLLFGKSWRGSALGDRRERMGYGLQTMYGGCWNAVGNLNHMNVRASKRYFNAWEALHNPCSYFLLVLPRMTGWGRIPMICWTL